MKRVLITFSFACLAGSVFAQINSNTISSSDNATIQPGGPRSGVNGKRFLNVESAPNGANASFAVVDFNGSLLSFGSTIDEITSLTVDFRQSNSGFTRDGALRFFLTADTSTNIQPGTSPLTYQAGQAPNGLGTQLSPNFLLGTGAFTQVANGDVDSYTFAVSGGAASLLKGAVTGGTTIRLIAAPDDNGVAATWGGGDNFSGIPSLTLTASEASVPPPAVPEPASMAVLGMGALAVLRRRRK